MVRLRCLGRLLLTLVLLAAADRTWVVPLYAQTVTLSGRISDGTTGVPGALVEVLMNPVGLAVATTSSDAAGMYSVSIAPGTYDVRVTPPPGSGFSVISLPNQSLLASTTLDIVLISTTAATLSGRVMDAAGVGVPNQQLQLVPAGGGSSFSAQTNLGGDYSFSVTAGSYRLYLNGSNPDFAYQMPGFYSFNVTTAFDLTSSTVFDLTLPARRVDVHVQDLAGTAVADVGLAVQMGFWACTLSIDSPFGPLTACASAGYSYTPGMTMPGMPPFPAFGVATNSSGNATLWLFDSAPPIPPLPTGYTLTATPPAGSSFGVTNVAGVTVSGPTPVTITLGETVLLSGTVRDAGGVGVPNQQVQLVPGAGGSGSSTQTDATGHYSFSVTAGSYRLYLNGSNPDFAYQMPGFYSFSVATAFDLTSPTVFDLTLPARRVDVHVQGLAGTGVADVGLAVQMGFWACTLSIDSPFGPLTACGSAGYSYTPGMTMPGMPPFPAFGVATNSSGNATLWLFDSAPPMPPLPTGYTLSATPPAGGPFAGFNVTAVEVHGSKDVLIVLQFTHDPPQSSLTALDTPAPDGSYPNPARFDLSATATAGYSVASIQYTVDGGPTQTYAGSFAVPGSGPHSIRYWAVDSGGVYEIAHVFDFAVTAALSVTVTSPNGGEKVFVGVAREIRWSATGSPTAIDVQLSRNNGAFLAIPECTGLPGSATMCLWTPNAAGNNSRVRVLVRDATGATATDNSDLGFQIAAASPTVTVTAPNTAVAWTIATVQQIRWTHNLGANASVRIELSRDAGATWAVIAASVQNATATTGTFPWIVTGPATSDALVRVTALDVPVSDAGNVPFTIAAASITVIVPNTAVIWRAGSMHNIRFMHNLGAGQPVALDVSRDAGATWSPIQSFTTTTAAIATVPWAVSGAPTTQARIRARWAADPTVSDTSDVNFTIQSRVLVTAPNTAVVWGAGSTRQIRWNHNLPAGETVDIALSPDAGATWIPIAAGVPNADSTTGSYIGALPAIVTTQALIRVSWTADPVQADISDVLFTQAAPSIALTAPDPNTNVNWGIGSARTIRWTQNLGTGDAVNIDISRDGGVTWESIAMSAPNSGNTTATFAWTVSGPPTASARIRVTWVTNGAVQAVSAVNFRIL